MGHTGSSSQEEKVNVPNDKYNAGSRQRQEYIHRLGIKRDGKSCIGVPTTQFHAPNQIREKARSSKSEQAAKSRSCSDASLADETKGESDGEHVNLSGSKDDFRISFLRKLSYEKVWLPKTQRPPSHQTVIIFDWDDTLLCTSYLNNLTQYWKMHPKVEETLLGIGKAAQQLLEMSLRLGQTFIITNAQPMWVQYSAAKYLPDLLPTLENVRVISARGRHEAQYPHDVQQWKVQAFLDVQRQLDSQVITNVVSLGDSLFEMNATHTMAKEFEKALVKTVKFNENPCPEALLKQLSLVATKFEVIVTNARNMKVALERKGST